MVPNTNIVASWATDSHTYTYGEQFSATTRHEDYDAVKYLIGWGEQDHPCKDDKESCDEYNLKCLKELSS